MNIIRIYGITTLLVFIAYLISTFTDINFEIKKGEVIPRDQWLQTMVGKWNIQYQIKNPQNVLDVTGTMVCNEDSTYTNVLTYQYYQGLPERVKPNKKYFNKAGKAAMAGKFKMRHRSTGQIYLNLISSTMRCREKEIYQDPLNSFQKLDFCLSTFNINSIIGDMDYGDGETYKLLLYTKNKIIMRITKSTVLEPIFVTYQRIED